MKTKLFTLAILLTVFLSCQTEGDNITLDESYLEEIAEAKPIYVDIGKTSWSFPTSGYGKYTSKSIAGESEDRRVELYKAEYFTSGNGHETGNTIFFNNRGNKQIGLGFVGNSQYNIFTDQTNDISYYIDESRPSNDIDVDNSTKAIESAMNTWNNVTCSELGIFKMPYDGRKTGVVAGNAHPIFDWTADVVHAGWMPVEFFDWFSGGRGANILGVTFTFGIKINGEWADDNNDGKIDTWFSEIYYNEAFQWSDDGKGIDIETVALHEAGHGLSQGHFGKAFRTNSNEKVHFAPRAVMNASYTGILNDIGKTDNGGHCSIWGNWPNN